MKSLYFLFQFILMAFETFTIAPISCPPPSVISNTATFLSDLGELGGTPGLWSRGTVQSG